MNIIRKQSTAIPIFILAFSLLISGCGGGAGSASFNDGGTGNNPDPISPIDPTPANPPPPAPVITTAEATQNSVFLDWTDESSRESGFRVLRDDVKVGETDRNISQWTDASVLPATLYTYVVSAWNKEGERASQEKQVTTLPIPAPLPSQNHPPAISSVLASPATIETSQPSSISCQASDPDNDPLTFSWSANAGVFTGSGPTVQWTAPANTGTYTIQCSVSDGRGGSGSGTTDIIVTDPVLAKWRLPQGLVTRSTAINQITGELYAAGMTYGSLPGFTNAGGTDIFLAKLNSDGTLAFAKQWGTADNDFDADLKVFGGKVYVSWGTDPYLISIYGLNISTFDVGGNRLWDIAFSNSESIESIVPIGNALYLFQVSPVLMFGVRIMKVDSETGLIIEMRDDSRWVMSNVIAADTKMYAFMSPPASRSFIGKYDHDAYDFLWNSQLWDDGGPSLEAYFDISANLNGVYVGGWGGFNSIIPPDQGGGSDPPRCLLLRYDAQGNFLWAHQDSRAGYFWRVESDGSAAYALSVPSGVCGLTKITNDGTVAWQTSVVGQALALFNNVLFVADGTNIIHRYDALTGESP